MQQRRDEQHQRRAHRNVPHEQHRMLDLLVLAAQQQIVLGQRLDQIFLPFFQQLCHRILPLRLAYSFHIQSGFAPPAVQSSTTSCKNAQCRANSSLLIAPSLISCKAQSPVPA